MCLLKKPKVATPVAATSSDKPLPVLINSGLDGRSQLSLARRGMSGLTIRRRQPGVAKPQPNGPLVREPETPTSPIVGGGGGGGGASGGSGSGSGISDRNLTALDALAAFGGSTGAAAKKLKLKV